MKRDNEPTMQTVPSSIYRQGFGTADIFHDRIAETMYRAILILSVIVLLALGGYYLYPVVRGKIEPDVDFDKVDAAYRAFLQEHRLTDPIPDAKIVVTKNNRMLYLLSGDKLIDRWKVALGSRPEGAKTTADDGRTPVGNYTICKHERQWRHHLGLVITYPGKHDADVALRSGAITERVHLKIYEHYSQNRLPPQDSSLGGGIAIQGGGTSRDWTNGSIAVADEVVEILWGACPDGTPVAIYENFTDWEMSSTMPSF